MKTPVVLLPALCAMPDCSFIKSKRWNPNTTSLFPKTERTHPFPTRPNAF